MIRRSLRPASLALACALAACSYTLDASHLGVPATLATAGATPPQGEPFAVNRKAVYLLWGAVPTSQPNLEDALVGQLGNAAALAHIRVRVRSSLSDVLITGLTLGLITPRTVTIEGVVVAR